MKRIDPLQYYKFNNLVEKSVIYVFLMPSKINDNLIIKIGYSKNVFIREEQIKDMFGISNIKLIFCYPIKSEPYEEAIHKYIKTMYNFLYIPIEKEIKTKKDEKLLYCVETYYFAWDELTHPSLGYKLRL